MDVSIDWLFTNGNTPDTKHFSADETGIYSATIAFFVLQSLLMVASLLVATALKNRRKLHMTVKILVFSIALQLLGLLLNLLYYSEYSKNGAANQSVLAAGAVLIASSDTCMVALLILLAKGWTIVRRKISVPGRIKIAVFLTVYFMAAVTVVAWRFNTLNSATELYYYASSAGVLFVATR